VGTGSSPRAKWPGCGYDHPQHLTPRLKKGWSYTPPPPLDLRILFCGELHINLYLYLLLF